jgi:two-component system response regulator PhoP
MRILLVEDEAPLRETLSARLKREGYAVDAASDGEEGIYLGREVPFDVAVIDLGLPRMSGMELVKLLRTEGKKFPILILTARSSWQDKVEGLKAGADDYLVKPFHVEELLARLNAPRAGASRRSTAVRSAWTSRRRPSASKASAST